MGTEIIDGAIERLCPGCGTVKSIAEFHRNGDGYSCHCGECRRKYQRQYQKSYGRKKSKLLYVYGLTMEQYLATLRRQNYVCAICGETEKVRRNGRVIGLAKDHHHATKKFRGLLCVDHNTGVGKFKDGKLFPNAIMYLYNSKAHNIDTRQLVSAVIESARRHDPDVLHEILRRYYPRGIPHA